MKEERKVVVYTCDDDRCQEEVIADGEMAAGYHGTVTHIDEHGGEGAEWFACKAAHIKAAILAALQRRCERN